jgi:hypothetical protein
MRNVVPDADRRRVDSRLSGRPERRERSLRFNVFFDDVSPPSTVTKTSMK